MTADVFIDDCPPDRSAQTWIETDANIEGSIDAFKICRSVMMMSVAMAMIVIVAHCIEFVILEKIEVEKSLQFTK